MKLSLMNAKETQIFSEKVSIRYFRVGEEVVPFGEEISEGDGVELSGGRLVPSSNNEQCWLINLVGHSIFLSSGGEILLKGKDVYNSEKISALVKMPINSWALCYDSFYDEFILFRFSSDKVEQESGVNADVATTFYGLEFPIEVTVEGEGDE